VLVAISGEVGLDAGEAQAALAAQRHVESVIADETLAEELGLGGVPAILVRSSDAPLETATLVHGAQPHEVLRSAVMSIRG
jgi:predicted DsbA family dithiol-disulfide isomerase